MSDYAYEGLEVKVRLRDPYAEFGVEINGHFYPLYGRKIGGFLADDAAAQAAQAEASSKPPAQG